MRKSTVKWFNDQKGFGFINNPDQAGKDIFVHHSVIEGQGFKTLVDGEEVELEFEERPQGVIATKVRRFSQASAPAP